MARRNIPELLQVPEDGHDLPWLHEALQWAVELEFATIPAYLSGMWSIEQPSDPTQPKPAYNLVLSVVMEEMLHLALACNMLTAIGGTPAITAPTYPGPLPGGVLPGLEVHLAGLSRDTLTMYMAIEQPETMPPQTDGESFPTIGAFYDAISAAFTALSPALSEDGQIGGGVGVPDPDNPGATPPNEISESFTTLTTLQQVQDAITLIKDQGEGTGSSPDAPQFDNGELAHYFRFGEILNGRQYVQTAGHWDYTGDPIALPPCHPVAVVPRGGYPGVPAVQAFDAKYGEVIAHLQGAWTGAGSTGQLGLAIGAMLQLGSLAADIVTQPLPGGGGNYGPDFVPANASAPATTGPGTGATMPVSFKSDVLPLFTEIDIDHMSQLGVSLGDYSYMSQPDNAAAVLNQVASGSMPPAGSGEQPWSQDKVGLLETWIAEGCQP